MEAATAMNDHNSKTVIRLKLAPEFISSPTVSFVRASKNIRIIIHRVHLTCVTTMITRKWIIIEIQRDCNVCAKDDGGQQLQARVHLARVSHVLKFAELKFIRWYCSCNTTVTVSTADDIWTQLCIIIIINLIMLLLKVGLCNMKYYIHPKNISHNIRYHISHTLW